MPYFQVTEHQNLTHEPPDLQVWRSE